MWITLETRFLSHKLGWGSWGEDRRTLIYQGHPTDRFGGISVRKTCNQVIMVIASKFRLGKCNLELS